MGVKGPEQGNEQKYSQGLTGKDEMDVGDKWKLEADSRSFAGARPDNVNGADCTGHVP
jgi:hypothetical protein